MQPRRARSAEAFPMKTVLILGLCLLSATLALPGASADMVEICSPSNSVVNYAQACANKWVDWTQEKAEDVFCDVVCNL